MATATRNRTAQAQATQTESGNETDVRTQILNTLLTTPHRDLAAIYPIHQNMIAQDLNFYGRLAAWYDKNGDVRDHKDVFVVCLILSDFPGHRDEGLALLRQMEPFRVTRVVDFICGRKEGKAGKGQVKTFGLFKNPPRSLKTEVTRYLREREANDDWFDGSALLAREDMQRLYAKLHINGSDRARQILFERSAPEDSRLSVYKRIREAEPAEQARLIIENKVPFWKATGVIGQMTPTVLFALVDVMSHQDLVNSLGFLKDRGAFDNPEIKAAIDAKLTAAKKGKRVSALKTGVAKKRVDEETAKKLDDIADTQVKAKGQIARSTAILIDKSQSMDKGIEVGKQAAAMLSAICTADFWVYSMDTAAMPIVSDGRDLASWNRSFAGVRAGGGTSLGCGLRALALQKRVVENIVLITDEEENTPPVFLTEYQNYCKTFAVTPTIVIVRMPNQYGRYTEHISPQLKKAGIEFDAWNWDPKGDYYSLTNLIPLLTKQSKQELILEIMSHPIPQRKAG